MAVTSKGEYLVSFGSGPDLHLVYTQNNLVSTSKIGSSYDGTHDTFAGAENFKVVEYEVFQVSF